MATLRKDQTETISVTLRELNRITEEKIEGYTAVDGNDRFFTLTEVPFDVNDVTCTVNGVSYTLNVDYKINEIIAGVEYQFEWIDPDGPGPLPAPTYDLVNGDILQIEYEYATKPIEGLPVTGLDDTDVTVYYRKNTFGSGSTQLVASPSNFVEVDAVNMPGVYEIQLSASITDTAGPFTITITPVVADTFADVTQEFSVYETAGGSFLSELTSAGVDVDTVLSELYPTIASLANLPYFAAQATQGAQSIIYGEDNDILLLLINAENMGYTAPVDPDTAYLSRINIMKADGSAVTINSAGSSYVTHITGNVYRLTLSSIYFDVPGPILVSYSGQVTALDPVQAGIILGTVEVPVLEQALTPTGVTVNDALEFLFHEAAGRWKINTTHPSGQPVLELYEADNSSLLAEFQLYDAGGSPTASNPFERIRILPP